MESCICPYNESCQHKITDNVCHILLKNFSKKYYLLRKADKIMTSGDICWHCCNKQYFPGCKPDRVETDNSEGMNDIIRCSNYNVQLEKGDDGKADSF